MSSSSNEYNFVDDAEFTEVSQSYHSALTGMLQGQREMDDAKFKMETASAQVEVSVIHDAGGDEKRVGSTETARKRAFDIARSKSTHYLATRDHYLSARNDYKYHQHMVRIFDLRLQFLIATRKDNV